MSLNPTGISYLTHTWNPVTGCTMGCDYCWARHVAQTRLEPAARKRMQQKNNTARGGPSYPLSEFVHDMDLVQAYRTFAPTLHPERLDAPVKRKKPAVIGVCFMGDLFDPALSPAAVGEVCAAMVKAPQHTFVLLTKRPDRLADCFESKIFDQLKPRPDWHLGFSATNQADFDSRWPHMAELAAAGWKVWLSLEPMLGPVDLDDAIVGLDYFSGDHAVPVSFIPKSPLSGVILGGQSGKNAQPLHPYWVRSVRDQCTAAGVPFHFKQWGEWGPKCDPNAVCRRNNGVWFGDVFQASYSDCLGVVPMWRRGTKKAGATLDRVEHKELAWELG